MVITLITAHHGTQSYRQFSSGSQVSGGVEQHLRPCYMKCVEFFLVLYLHKFMPMHAHCWCLQVQQREPPWQPLLTTASQGRANQCQTSTALGKVLSIAHTLIIMVRGVANIPGVTISCFAG